MSSAPEFSFPVRLDTVGDAPRELALEAGEAERAALAERFGLVAIDRLSAGVTLQRNGDRIACDGRLRAQVTQSCVATGEPVSAKLDEPFQLLFEPARDEPPQDEIELDEGDLDILPYAGSAIDVGEAIAQTLALALDPFPRAPDAEQALRAAGVVGEAEVGPFAALKGLKDRL